MNLLATTFEYGDFFTKEEFIEAVKLGFFTNYDGYGYGVSNGEVDENNKIYPSEYRSISSHFDGILWFNK